MRAVKLCSNKILYFLTGGASVMAINGCLCVRACRWMSICRVQTGSTWRWYQRCQSSTSCLLSSWTWPAANHSRQLQLLAGGRQRIAYWVWLEDDGEAGGRAFHLGTTTAPVSGLCSYRLRCRVWFDAGLGDWVQRNLLQLFTTNGCKECHWSIVVLHIFWPLFLPLRTVMEGWILL